MLMTTLVLSIPVVLAGYRNQNDITNGKSVDRGTGKVNGKDGCAPPTQSGDRWVNMGDEEELANINLMLASMPNPDGSYWQINSMDWKGGPCCPSNTLSDTVNEHPLPNQCCNAPDMDPPGTGVPGNHCMCFSLRGYPIPIAADLIFP